MEKLSGLEATDKVLNTDVEPADGWTGSERSGNEGQRSKYGKVRILIFHQHMDIFRNGEINFLPRPEKSLPGIGLVNDHLLPFDLHGVLGQ